MQNTEFGKNVAKAIEAYRKASAKYARMARAHEMYATLTEVFEEAEAKANGRAFVKVHVDPRWTKENAKYAEETMLDYGERAGSASWFAQEGGRYALGISPMEECFHLALKADEMAEEALDLPIGGGRHVGVAAEASWKTAKYAMEASAEFDRVAKAWEAFPV